MKNFFLILFLSGLLSPLFSQQNDSLVTAADSIALAKENRKKTYSVPRRASIMSAVLPGLGQAYNGKYWKIPVIYAGFGGFGYMFYVNNTQYWNYRRNLIAENDGDSTTVNQTRWGSTELQTQKVFYRKRRDIAIVGIAVLYVLNIIDANVDAHLKTFDVSDDLSIQLDPWQMPYRLGPGYKVAMGLSIKFNLK